jgi:hypothetical protein
MYIHEWTRLIADIVENPDDAQAIVDYKLIPLLRENNAPEEIIERLKRVDDMIAEIDRWCDLHDLTHEQVIQLFRKYTEESERHEREGITEAPNTQTVACTIAKGGKAVALRAILECSHEWVCGMSLEDRLIKLMRDIGFLPPIESQQELPDFMQAEDYDPCTDPKNAFI